MKYTVPYDIHNTDTIYGKIIPFVKPNTTVLEFGPAGGWITKYLKEELNCDVYIVEIDKDGFEQANQFAKKGFLGDIETYEWLNVFEGVQFDFIIFADVLEHLYDPYKALKRCNEILKGDGSILISIPNIANNNIIMNLLENKFAYSEMGILDRTHVRFFTYYQLLEMIKDAGYYPVVIDAVYYEVGQKGKEIETSYENIPLDVAQYIANREHADIYQFVVQIKSKNTKEEEQTEDLLKKREFRFVFNCNRTLYIDRGNGFNESIHQRIDKSKKQIASFNLKDTNGIKQLRFDPFCGMACQIQIENIETDIKNFCLEPLNADRAMSDHTCKFYHKSPMYLLTGEFSESSRLVIQYLVEPIDWNEGIEEIKRESAKYKKELNDINAEHTQTLKEFENMACEFRNTQEELRQVDAELRQVNEELRQAKATINITNEALANETQRYFEAMKTINEIYQSKTFRFAQRLSRIKNRNK